MCLIPCFLFSTLSSCGNSAACMVWEDFLKPLLFFSKLSDKSATLVVKILSSFTGVLSVVLGLVMGSLGNIFHVVFSISSCLNGPLSGLFLTGILLPWVNAKNGEEACTTSRIASTASSACIAMLRQQTWRCWRNFGQQRHGGGQGCAPKARGWGKLMPFPSGVAW
ncbi:Sodium-coupled monocarboxylate transporter 1 [Chionoecetes opilio]|uniref:Sodium-coupled monocarboxylate transporter 1 n=1 Tax=Chionoecetes opilio TaxID=41210 RepID=A0A8J5CJW6_CHIOP|nr:Sodium-coupled monocarboxylate transporter 1 [Chionoecetes opilio]